MRLPAQRAWAVFVIALLVRLAHLLHVAPTPFFELHKSFAESDMRMFDEWSRSIAAGDWLGRRIEHPLYAWQLSLAPEDKWREWYGHPRAFYKAPFYAYLLAVLRKLFGDPMLPAALLQCLASSLAAVALIRLGDRTFGPPAGFASGMLFAVYAPAVHFDVVLLRGPWITLAALLATLSLARFADDPRPRRAFVAGLWVALSLLVNEGFALVPVVVLLLLPLWIRPLRAILAPAGGFALGLALGLLPLVIRNLAVGAPPLQLAVTGSVVYAVFNAAGANPWAFEIRPQVLAPLMQQAGAGVLEMALACLRGFPSLIAIVGFYLQRVAGLVIPFENPDNANFYYAALIDPLLAFLPGYGVLLPLIVAGAVAARSRLRSLAPLAPYVLTTFASIVLTATLSRYRVVLASLLVPLAGLALATAWKSAQRRDVRGLALLGGVAVLAAATAALLERRLDRAGGLLSLRYRHQEFYLGAEGWAARGQYDRAVAEMRSLVQHNRDALVQAWALHRASQLLILKGDRRTAQEVLRLAARTGRDPLLLMAVGDVRRRELGDVEGARAAYEEALGLSPEAPLRMQIEERLRLMEAEGPLA